MSFNPNIPQSTDDLSDSQGDLLQNNLALDASFGRDHLPFSNLTADNGKHKFVEMVSATLPAPVPGLSSGSGTIYTKSVGTPTESQVFYTPDASGAEFQLTTAKSASISQFSVMSAYGTPPATATQEGGWTFLPGALLFQYGKYIDATVFQGSGSTSATIQFPISFPAKCFVVNITLITNLIVQDDAAIAVSLSPSTTAFTVKYHRHSTTNVRGIYWTAIGN